MVLVVPHLEQVTTTGRPQGIVMENPQPGQAMLGAGGALSWSGIWSTWTYSGSINLPSSCSLSTSCGDAMSAAPRW